jgi:hypothetical protein
MTPSRVHTSPRSFALVGLVLGAAFGGACRKPPPPAQDRILRFFPGDARAVASVDLAAMRASVVWQRLSALGQDAPADRRMLAEMAERTGTDALQDLGRLVVAVPEDARTRGAFGLVVEAATGKTFDEKRLVTFARDRAALAGNQIVMKSHAGRRLWVGGDGSAGFFPDDRTFVMGGGGWAEVMAELNAGQGGGPTRRSAADSPELSRFCERVSRREGGSEKAVWVAALMPAAERRALMADPRFEAAAAINRLGLALEPGAGLDLDVVAEFSTAEDAREMAGLIEALVREAKGDPRVLLLGVGPYLAGVSSAARGPTLRLGLSLTSAQISDLMDRLEAALRLSRRKKALAVPGSGVPDAGLTSPGADASR